MATMECVVSGFDRRPGCSTAKGLRFPCSALAVAVALLGSTSSLALPVFVAPDACDWFDGASWSNGVVPTSTDDPAIGNGAKATASSASPFYPGPGTALQAGDLAIGSRLGSASPAVASGELTSSDVAVSGAGRLSVGVIDVPPEASPSTVSGALSVTSGDQSSGDVTVAGLTRVGTTSLYQPDDGSTAAGVLEVGGDLETTGLLLGAGGDTASGQVAV